MVYNGDMKRKRTIYMLDGGEGRQYIGQTVDLENRLRQHRGDCGRGAKQALYNAVRKHGWDAFPLRILMTTEPITDFQSNAVEVWFIAFHNTYRNGLNETVGGSGSTGHTHEVSQDARDRIGAAKRGVKRGPHTKEHRDKIGASLRGKKRSLNAIANMSAARIGKKATPEACANMSAAHIGNKHSQETRDKMIASSAGAQFRKANIDRAMSLLSLGWTQWEVGLEIGVSKRTIASWKKIANSEARGNGD